MAAATEVQGRFATRPLMDTIPAVSSVFQHGVASGDPTTDSVIIWTRVRVPVGDNATVSWFVADHDGNELRTGVATARSDHDWTLSIEVTGLGPATQYRFWFQALGELSPVGLTRTLPADKPARVRFAQVSCAKFNAGYFNAYARIAERHDLDFVLHLGDYIYEASQTPPASQTASADIGRPFDPLHECRSLEDYRRRYAQYRSDPDVQALHAAHPLIATVDDHEFADGAWKSGAAEHLEERDGPWSERLAAAFQAREEWLPIRRPNVQDPTQVFRSVPLGELAELLLIDTRTQRDLPCPEPGMSEAERSALGEAQREWLFDSLGKSTAKWRLLGNPSVLSHTWSDSLSIPLKEALVKVKLMDIDAAGCDWDQWDGYPGERDALLTFLSTNRIENVVVLSGDVHVGMAIEVARRQGESPVAVEFVNASLTSQNLDDKMGWQPLTESIALAEEFVKGLDHVKWVDFDSHGYSVVEVTPQRVLSEWWSVDAVSRRTERETCVAAWQVLSGRPHILPADH